MQQLAEAGWASRPEQPYKPLGGRIILDMPHPSLVLRRAHEDEARGNLALGTTAFKAQKRAIEKRKKVTEMQGSACEWERTPALTAA